MGKNDMNHLEHLETVALSDCAVLESKEATYQGSWKRAGGRSAWFMARRNLDRLITMMDNYELLIPQDDIDTETGKVSVDLKQLQRTLASEDLFLKIRQNPGGEDGTVLACMRDARRYFMLVEAEMIAEGVVEPETKTYESEHSRYPDDIDVTSVRIELTNTELSSVDTYTIENVTELIKEDNTIIVKAERRRASPRPPIDVQYREPAREPVIVGDKILQQDRPPRPATVVGYDGVVIKVNDYVEWSAPGVGALIAKVEDVSADQSSVFIKSEDEKTFEIKVTHVRRTDMLVGDQRRGGGYAAEQAARNAKTVGKKLEDTKITTMPWEIDNLYMDILSGRVGTAVAEEFYARRAPNVWRLEAVVSGDFKCPREVADCYEWTVSKNKEGLPSKTYWILKREKVPAELDDQFPKFQVEKNIMEFEKMPVAYHPLYEWHEEPQKWILAPKNMAWGADA